MTIISASALISELASAGPNAAKFVQAIEAAVQDVGKEVMVISIDTDDDFAVNGHSNYVGHFIVDGSLTEVYKKAIATLVFTNHVNSQYKVDDFKKLLKSRDTLAEVSTGHASRGGNQTLDVSIVSAATELVVGPLTIDLLE
jgi:ribonuclease HI